MSPVDTVSASYKSDASTRRSPGRRSLFGGGVQMADTKPLAPASGSGSGSGSGAREASQRARS